MNFVKFLSDDFKKFQTEYIISGKSILNIKTWILIKIKDISENPPYCKYLCICHNGCGIYEACRQSVSHLDWALLHSRGSTGMPALLRSQYIANYCTLTTWPLASDLHICLLQPHSLLFDVFKRYREAERYQPSSGKSLQLEDWARQTIILIADYLCKFGCWNQLAHTKHDQQWLKAWLVLYPHSVQDKLELKGWSPVKVNRPCMKCPPWSTQTSWLSWM